MKVLSEEHKKKISDSMKNRVLSEKHKQNIKNSKIGRRFSEEHKENLSQAKVGKKYMTRAIIENYILAEINEEKSVVLAFGRMNPPTVGHEKLVKKIQSVAKEKGATAQLYVSHTQDAKKNPLDYDEKISFLKKAFGSIVKKSDDRTILHILKTLNGKFDKVYIIAGSDRVAEFLKLVNTYNGRDYKFDSIEVVSAGERDADSDDAVSSMSASKLRSLAASGDFDTFKSGLPVKLQKYAKIVYAEIRNKMNIKEAGPQGPQGPKGPQHPKGPKKEINVSYERQGGNKSHSTWKVHLNNGRIKKVWADSRANAKTRLNTSELIIGVKKIVPHIDHMKEEYLDEAEGLWKFNKRSGLWDHQRAVTPETKDQWLKTFKDDEPNEHFVISKNKPNKKPSLKESAMNINKFSKSQLDALIKNYATIKTIDPDSPTYKKMTDMLDKMPEVNLQQLVDAKVPWLGKLAANRIRTSKNTADTKKTFPNVKHVTKDGHPDWAKHGVKEESIDEARQSKHQKYAIGDKVFITKDLPVNMKHFTGGVKATVVGTYAQEYGAQGIIGRHKMYTLKIPGEGEVSWYDEDQLTLVSSNKSVKEESIGEASEDIMQRLKKRINIRMNRSKLVRGRQNAEIAREEVQNDDVIQVYIDRINKQKIKEGIRG